MDGFGFTPSTTLTISPNAVDFANQPVGTTVGWVNTSLGQVVVDNNGNVNVNGVTAANADEMTKSSAPAIQRLLGTSGDLGSRLGLDNKWMVQAIKAGGNYAEIFERNVGKASPLKLDRGLNATWSKGGLMYAIPFK